MFYPTIQKAIIKGFLTDEVFVAKAIPYLKPEYFKNLMERELLREAMTFYTTYQKLPTEAALAIAVGKNLPSQENKEELKEYITGLRELSVQTDWLIKHTETFCRDAAFEISVSTAVDVLEGTAKVDKHDIPRMIQDSLSISFDPSQSHDFFRDYEKQLNWYKEKVDKIPFDIELLNKITCGGVERKTLNVLLASTGAGKSLFMCHFAAKYLEQGYNVLYLTLELSENKIRQRIDANLLDIPINNFQNIEDEFYFSKMKLLKSRVKGVLKIHEFPPAAVNANHFKQVIQELQLKDNFTPDIIFIDYLNLMNSARVRQGKSYEVVKAVAEECRGLGVELNACVWTGTQTNRDGYTSDDLGLENTSDSMGLPFTSDIFLGLTQDENLAKARHVRIKQLKSRYGDINFYNKFIVGVDKLKMRLINVDQVEAADAQAEGGEDSGSAFDRSRFGKGMAAEKPSFDDFDFDT